MSILIVQNIYSYFLYSFDGFILYYKLLIVFQFLFLNMLCIPKSSILTNTFYFLLVLMAVKGSKSEFTLDC